MNVFPCMVVADSHGNIVDLPEYRMACNRGGEWKLPDISEMIPLPPESELFLLPGRRAVGYNTGARAMEARDLPPVAAFVSPGYTLDAHPAYVEDSSAPVLPLFAYGAVGYARGRFWVCARKVDNDPRQRFEGISQERIEKNCRRLLREYPGNRLAGHIINNCVRRYACPAARNFALGRYEAPLPTSRMCNARCMGCISSPQADSPLSSTPQCRLDFTPSPEEIVEIMCIHERREKKRPIYSFGQGCEGDPLLNAPLLAKSIRLFRSMLNKGGGTGTVNCNTNGSLPDAVEQLARSGLTSMRISLNSARIPLYEAYYRPQGYSLEDVCASMRTARRHGVFVSLNLLYFPGITDTPAELDALARLVAGSGVSMIQWRNLNIDPRWYLDVANAALGRRQKSTIPMGLSSFMAALEKRCPWLLHGYFNPYLGTRAKIEAPMPAFKLLKYGRELMKE